jgi:glycosyltransferase involved in cell wall biosynthesis
MHVALNAQLLSLDRTYRGAGINTYIHQLLRHLGQSGAPHRCTVFLNERRFTAEGLVLHHTHWLTSRPAVRILWEQLALPGILRRSTVDLLHAMAFVAPTRAPCPFVVTIYDLSFLRQKEAFRPFNRWYLSRFTRISAQRARRIIAISESTKRDIVQFLNVSPERVDVIYCGVDSNFRRLSADQVDRFRCERGLPDRFVLYVGTLEPRKNLDRLIRAYGRWRAGDPTAPQLVVAGAKGWYYGEVFRAVQAMGLVDHVTFPGYLPYDELPLWYNAAALFVYPSLFEGFGLPVLEAMACGTPVICSNTASLPEVAGDAALLLAPGDERGLAEAMRAAWGDAGLRQQMSERGEARACLFSWDRTARQTVQTYERALG